MNRIHSLSAKSTFRITTTLWIGLHLVLTFTPSTLAQTGGDFELSRNTIGYTGGQSSGGDFTLTGVIGQPEAGIISGGDYDLLGGFLPGRPVCTVEFHHFARFAEYWLDTGIGLKADLDDDDDVDLDDLSMFIDEWLDYCSTDWPLK
ncbi:MAG: hypothetical protein ACYS1A_18670 [Planctomycetota bacterium]|jgi:hypothetical protein